MKVLFSSIPQWYPASPYLACALLAGQLGRAGFDADTYDFNIAFFNDILTCEQVGAALEKAKRFLETPFTVDGDLPPQIRAKLLETAEVRKNVIEAYLAADTGRAARVIAETENAVKVMKTKELFYDPEQYYRAKDVLADALDILSLPWAPARIRLDNFIANPVFTYDFPDVDFQCRNAAVNMFLPYFEKALAGKDLSAYDLIGLSVTDLSQIVPGLTLARLLKQKTKAKICLGGNYIFKIAPDIKKIPQIFTDYCDFLLIGDGERTVVELAEYLDGRRSVETVHSLIYADADGVIRETETAPLLDLDAVAYPDFDGYDFGAYLTPETVIPVQLGKGCYWGKCTFCDFYTGQQKFDMKHVTRAVDEVEYLSKKYGSPYFNFVDEAVPPAFYDKFAAEVLRRGLKIFFYSFARLEKAFKPEVLQNLYRAGARFFMWGYEAASERVMGLMNKGIDLSRREQILSDAVDAGLWNLCTFLLCYPTETPEELQATIDVIYNDRLVDTCTPSNFALKKNAILKNDVSAAAITDFQANGELHISYKYHSTVTTMEEIKRKRNSFERKFLQDSADRLFAHTFTESDALLLYLAHYGREFVKTYRLKYKREL
ncbi:MAG: radical SAM protein [Clostridia bacterium]|nr:radical SAM protein [Clostridia bacterium]